MVDNYFTGSRRKVEQWLGHHNFELLHHDIVIPLLVEVSIPLYLFLPFPFLYQVDEIYHLASPASPPHCMYNPVRTIKTNTVGTVNMLGLARRTGARGQDSHCYHQRGGELRIV